MPKWLSKVLAQIAQLAAARRVAFTLKARRELTTLGLGLDPEDARDILMNLSTDDSAGRLMSAATGDRLCQIDRPDRLRGHLVSRRRRSRS